MKKINFKIYLATVLVLFLCKMNFALATTIQNPGNQQVNEDETLEFTVAAPAGVRVFIRNKPPGAIWNEVQRKFTFTPDFIQGGNSWDVTLESPEINSSVSFTITVNDTIQPTAPIIVSELDIWQAKIYYMKIVPDPYLDSPGFVSVGREVVARVVVPDAANEQNKHPLVIGLHSAGANDPLFVGDRGKFGVSLMDPGKTWWTGYSDQLPLQEGEIVTSGTVYPYSQRRVMHLFDYVVRNYPGVDLDNVRVLGTSMGGVGGMMLTTRFARHLNVVSGALGSSSLSRLSDGEITRVEESFFGSRVLGLLDEKGNNVWDSYDANYVALNDPDFKNLFFYEEFGQNDGVVPFKGVTQRSELTGKSFIETLQDEGIGHLFAWDQRGHGEEPAPYKFDWWFNSTTRDLDHFNYINQLIRNRAMPVFSNASSKPEVDLYDEFGNLIHTGYLRGVINRYFRWDGAATTEDRDHVSIPIRTLTTQEGMPNPDPDFPAIGTDYFGPLPITTDVTIRRLSEFQLLPNESVKWTYGDQNGTTMANADGSVTIRTLAVDNQLQTLTVTRSTTSDTEAPTVSITSPTGGTVSGTISVAVDAADDVGVTTVELFANGQLVGTSNQEPYTFTLDTTTVTDGDYALTAQASDAAGNQGTASAVTVTVQNDTGGNNEEDTEAPTIAITKPESQNEEISGIYRVTFNAQDHVGVTRVELYREENGERQLIGFSTQAPFDINWDTTQLANGQSGIRARAFDAAGNDRWSFGIGVIINNVADTTAPAVSITSPTGGTVSGTISVAVSATDNVGVTAVELFVNGQSVGTRDQEPYTFALDTTTLTDGNYALTAQALDAAGNQGTASTVTVTVQNNTGSEDTEAPTIGIASPGNYAVVSGITRATFNTHDHVGVTRVELYYELADGTRILVGTSTQSPFDIDWDTTQHENSSAHGIRARAYDAAGNSRWSYGNNITINN